MSTTATVHPASRKQIDYVKDLLDERELPLQNSTLSELKERAEELNNRAASKWIETLKALPKKHAAQRPTGSTSTIKSDVPEGRYAVTGEDGTTDFYKVDRPTEGKWAGYIFVKLGLGGPHGDPRWERIPLRNVQTILNKIAADGPKEAMLRYGKELGHCGHCGRTLTNPESIEAGIGPVCRGKMGW
jgi:hypothetical protein